MWDLPVHHAVHIPLVLPPRCPLSLPHQHRHSSGCPSVHMCAREYAQARVCVRVNAYHQQTPICTDVRGERQHGDNTMQPTWDTDKIGTRTAVSRTPAGTHAFFAHNHPARCVYGGLLLSLPPPPTTTTSTSTVVVIIRMDERPLYPLTPEERFVIRVLAGVTSYRTAASALDVCFLTLPLPQPTPRGDSVTPFFVRPEEHGTVRAMKIGRTVSGELALFGGNIASTFRETPIVVIS